MRKEELIDHHDYFISWLNELRDLEEDKWYSPMEEGKWSIGANVSHITKWDQYSVEHILLTDLQDGAVLPPFPEFEEFNRKAAAYALSAVTQEQLLAEGIEARKSIRAYIEALTEERLDLSFEVGDHLYTLREFFEDFMGHDKHHQNQIEEALHKENA
ncbi:DinB family protein [Rossellomorea aquimaris]|uniref:DinB family protein n=1 Tax=Rossellomorea aquimaris TaxID=189382 RepID=UPI001CD201F4|nr:DinB family protein [Rossellomorea aquimaris]MCA1057273.1 DinB family protein [Rossellomorea aquimaris]